MVADGWRFLSLKPSEVEALTPREFHILMRAQQERQFDDYEREAFVAIMHENAARSKRLKMSDLFKRPVDATLAKKKTQELAEKAKMASDWISQFTLFNNQGKEGE